MLKRILLLLLLPVAAFGQAVEDATHVWLDTSENFQSACTDLNTALDAANTDGWLYVWGGTYMVTAPLVCNGASATERMHVICMGGYPDIKSNGRGAGCRIIPSADINTEATMKIDNTDLQGFYIQSDMDSGDSAITVTGSADIHRNSIAWLDSADNPGAKYLIKVNNGAATTPVVTINKNFLYVYCSNADSECHGSSAVVLVQSGETGNLTDNTYITDNRIVLDGSTRASPNQMSVLYFDNGDLVEVSGNTVDLFQDTGNFIQADNDGTTMLDFYGNRFRAADSSTNPSGGDRNGMAYLRINGAGNLLLVNGAWTHAIWQDGDYSFNIYGSENANRSSVQFENGEFSLGRGGNTSSGGGTTDTEVEREANPLGANTSSLYNAAAGGFGGFRLSRNATVNTCAAAYAGTLYYDTEADKVCICSDRSGAYVWESINAITDLIIGSNTDCG